MKNQFDILFVIQKKINKKFKASHMKFLSNSDAWLKAIKV
eukprot:UN07664